MAKRPASICPCGHRVPPGMKCPCAQKREQERKARHDATRPSARARGYDSKWDRERAEYLKAHPRCQHVKDGKPCGNPSTVVHHIEAHKGDRKLFWRRSNWLSVCKACHDGPLQRRERATPRTGQRLSGVGLGPAEGGQKGRDSIPAQNFGGRRNGS